jgi:hypothetical protein
LRKNQRRLCRRLTVQLSQRLAGMTDKQWTEGLWRKLNIVQDFI